jgi:hypothetical protein
MSPGWGVLRTFGEVGEVGGRVRADVVDARGTAPIEVAITGPVGTGAAAALGRAGPTIAAMQSAPAPGEAHRRG